MTEGVTRALSIWQEKLDYLLAEEAIASSF